MCGICGGLSLDGRPLPEGLAATMNDTLAHRGPDDADTFVAAGVALGHRRLSILDLGGGHQPTGNETGDVVVVFNGEIYNFAERNGLEVRVPLLDERVVELALRLPSRLRQRGLTLKYLLRRSAASGGVPRDVIGERKTGFVIPLRSAAGTAIDALLAETIDRPQPLVEALFDLPAVRKYSLAFRTGAPPPDGISRWQLDQRVYLLIGLERWMSRWNISA